MKEYLKRKGSILGIYVLCFCVLEISVFMMNFGALPEYILFDISYLLLVCSILLLGGVKTQIGISIFLLFIQVLVCFVNANMIKVTGEIWSWDMLSLLSEAAEVLGRNFIVNYTCLILFIAISGLGVYAMIMVYLRSKNKNHKVETNQIVTIKTSVLLSFFLISLLCNAVSKNALNVYSKTLNTGNDLYLYETLYIKQEAYRKFGTLGYYVLDAQKTFFNNSTKSKEATVKKIDDYFAKATDEVNFITGTSEGNNVILILYETGEWVGINKDVTPNLYSLLTGVNDKYGNELKGGILFDNYYAKSQTNISEAQMLFGSYPLKGILNFDYEKNAYPFTLPNMFKTAYPESTAVSYHNNYGNYYDRENSHLHYGFDKHVSASEMNLSEGNSTWINMDSEMFESCLINGGKYTGCEAIVPENTEEPFLRYLATFSTHGPFDERSEYYGKGYYAFIDKYLEDNNYTTTTLHGDEIDFTGVKYESENSMENAKTYAEYLRTYLAATHDFDRGIGLLIDELRDRDLLEDTTIMIAADHYAYYHWLSCFTKGYPEGDMEISDVYNVPAFIFDTKLYSKLNSYENGKLPNGYNVYNKEYMGDSILTYDKFVTNIDITPTLLNILGIDYNERHYSGYSAFSENESMIISRWGGYFNNLFYSNDGITVLGLPEQYYEYEEMEELVELEGMTISEYQKIKEQVDIFRVRASDFLIRIDMINNVYRTDYFKKDE